MTFSSFKKAVRFFSETCHRNPYFFLVIYLPVIFYVLIWLTIKARSLTFVTLVNPGIRYGGLVPTSKFRLNQQFAVSLIPKAIYLNKWDNSKSILQKMAQNNIKFPIVLKPDNGGGGLGVTLIKEANEIDTYLSKTSQPTILEEYINLKEEYAILYSRLPNQQQGKITSFAKKKLIKVTGDGVSTLRKLIKNNPSLDHYRNQWYKKLKYELEDILPLGTEKIITPLGICSHGVKCIDLSDKLNQQIIAQIDTISHCVDGFFFGRYDIRANSLEDLQEGNFKIIELNGVGSLPLHIYDTKTPLQQCFKDLVQHWDNIYEIAQLNRQQGVEADITKVLAKAIAKTHYHKLFNRHN